MTQDKKPPADDKLDQDQAETPNESSDRPTETVANPAPGPAITEFQADSGRSSTAGAGLWLGVLNLLAVIALGAGGYLHLQDESNTEFRQQQRVDDLQETVNELDVARQGRNQRVTGIEEQAAETRRQVNELQRQQGRLKQQLVQTEAALAKLADQVQGGAHAWQRAEIEHLLLVANTRLQLQRDLEGAETALKLADERLAGLANPAYFEVRKLIARELGQVEAVPRLDLQALALQLDSLSSQVESLATRQPRVGRFDTELSISGGAPELPWHQRLWVSVQEAVGSLVSIRRDMDRREPLLPPDQSIYLRQNLRLQIESARLAALKRDTTNFRASLSQAESWLQRYFDTDKQAVNAALQNIRKLQALQLDPPLPDISGSLKALRRAGAEA